MTSSRPQAKQLEFDFTAASSEAGGEEPGNSTGEPQRGESCRAVMEKPALDPVLEALMEQIVDRHSLDRAWRKVRRNGGAPGPDGITLKEFPKHIQTLWPRLRQELLEGTYQPAAARRKSIPKPDGSERHLGIPNVQDRVIQQAILQVLTPIFDPSFSESSFGFRPKRSAHGAAKQVQRIIRQKHRYCVDMDLSKFFDRVQHDVLMHRVARKVHDKRLLRLIGSYLRAGVMVDGLLQPSHEGTMQGGPLSPFLANILLDDFDKELEKRGLPFVRYADDFLIFTKTEAASQRVFRSVEDYLTRKLKLVVNQQKSRTLKTDGVEFLGFQFQGWGGQIRVAPKNLKKFKEKTRDITSRSRGIPMRDRLQELRQYFRGWGGYFALVPIKTAFTGLDAWTRRRVRMCYWKQWRLPRTRIRQLKAMGLSSDLARTHGTSRKGPWRLSKSKGLSIAMPTKWLTDQGLVSLESIWNKLAPLR